MRQFFKRKKDDLAVEAIGGVVAGVTLAILGAAWLLIVSVFKQLRTVHFGQVVLWLNSAAPVVSIAGALLALYSVRQVRRIAARRVATEPPLPTRQESESQAVSQPQPYRKDAEHPLGFGTYAPEEQELLCAMFHNGNTARIERRGGRTPGEVVVIGATSYSTEGDPGIQVAYELSLKALEKKGLVRDAVAPNWSSNRHERRGERYLLTDEGKRLALTICPIRGSA